MYPFWRSLRTWRSRSLNKSLSMEDLYFLGRPIKVAFGVREGVVDGHEKGVEPRQLSLDELHVLHFEIGSHLVEEGGQPICVLEARAPTNFSQSRGVRSKLRKSALVVSMSRAFAAATKNPGMSWADATARRRQTQMTVFCIFSFVLNQLIYSE
eukprot:TRINITY_DN5709_c0_g3_i2.p1 TRINITY_DN5709_c0_g3~~TRINITY_DN5709_c0_g3_i2.p1  ORF type:complete len:154 (-),score=1.18 TRINITY_DN5709_c0_g3_i2:163-624(-)